MDLPRPSPCQILSPELMSDIGQDLVRYACLMSRHVWEELSIGYRMCVRLDRAELACLPKREVALQVKY